MMLRQKSFDVFGTVEITSIEQTAIVFNLELFIDSLNPPICIDQIFGEIVKSVTENAIPKIVPADPTEKCINPNPSTSV